MKGLVGGVAARSAENRKLWTDPLIPRSLGQLIKQEHNESRLCVQLGEPDSADKQGGTCEWKDETEQLFAGTRLFGGQ